MSVDVAFCEKRGGQWAPAPGREQLASPDRFLVLAYAFGLVLSPIRDFARAHPDPVRRAQIAHAVETFDRYVKVHRAEGLARFRAYYEFLDEVARAMRRDGIDPGGRPAVEMLPLETIDEDARVFFGRFILTERVIEPEEAAWLNPVIGLALGLFSNYATKYRVSDPNLARILEDARETLAVAARYCDQAVERGKRFSFSL